MTWGGWGWGILFILRTPTSLGPASLNRETWPFIMTAWKRWDYTATKRKKRKKISAIIRSIWKECLYVQSTAFATGPTHPVYFPDEILCFASPGSQSQVESKLEASDQREPLKSDGNQEAPKGLLAHQGRHYGRVRTRRRERNCFALIFNSTSGFYWENRTIPLKANILQVS